MQLNEGADPIFVPKAQVFAPVAAVTNMATGPSTVWLMLMFLPQLSKRVDRIV